jgi:acyl transferase domain-containing protein
MALAGGAHLILSPVKTITLAAAGLLAPDGRCKCFSEHANGYVRGEGVGIVVLMPLDAAIRDGHRVLALILGSAVNHNGVSNGLSGPSGAAQQELIRTALSRSGVKPSQIGYVEAHALGTRIGDEIEVRALSEVLSDGRIRGDRLIVGSAKGNFGHLEAAAGIAAFIKTAMILEKGIIPKTVGAEPLSGKLQPTDFLYIATAKHVWPDDSDARKAAVSSLSFGGANAHIVMQKAPFTGTPTQNRDQYYVLTFSANSTAALDALAHRYVEFLSKEQRVTESFADVCFTAAVGREPLPHRIAIVAKSFVDAADTLTRLLSRSAERTKAFRGHAVRRNTGRRSWIFDGSVRVDLSDAPDPVNSMYLEIRDLLATNDAMRSVLNNGSDVEPPLSTVALGAVVCAMIRSPAAVVGDDVEQCVSKALADQVWRSQSLIDPIGVKSVPQYAAKAVSEVSGIAEKWYFCAYERDLSESADRRNELRVPTFQMDENGSVGVVGGMEIARALAHAHVAGELIDWNRVFGVLRRTSVPLYPFERTTHWRTTAVS